MNQVFVRSEQLADKIHDIKLYIPEWKVLFSLDGRKNEDNIAGFLETDLQEVQNSLKKLQEMELIVPESGELPTAEELEPSDQDVDFVDEKLSPFEKVEEVSETVEEQPDEVEQVTESEPQEFDVPLEIKEEESKESVVSEDLSPSPDMQEDSAQLSEEQKPEGFEELKLEEAPEEKEEESEQDLDSLINDLLKEESVSEQGGEGPKILDEEEMAQWAEEEVKPEPPSPTPDEEEKSEEKPGEMGTPETETDVELKEEAVMEETLEVSTEETLTPEVEETEETATEEPAQEVPGVVTETDPQTRKTILVVDDSIVIRKMVEIALENESYNIVSVPTGKEAFSYLDSKDPDLVILDIMLPDVNGLDILKAIKAKTTIPVVMLSAKDTPKETSQAKELGADDFIPKPFRDEELVGKIHELIGQ
ncbi:MAG: response regulator [Calditrichia bacterium]|nr:response regulator [Calditrichia bacterium]